MSKIGFKIDLNMMMEPKIPTKTGFYSRGYLLGFLGSAAIALALNIDVAIAIG